MPVEIAITFQTDSSYGGSPLWGPLAQATETLDCDVRALSVHLLAPGTGRGSGAGVEATRPPRCRWSPKTGHLRLEYVTRDGGAAAVLSPSQFREQVAELAGHVEAQADRLRKRSGADVGSLLASMRALEARVPRSQPEFLAFLSDAARAGDERQARLPWWEQLGVRWERWHPAARERLQDRLFWEEEDDVAPHGNDTGADLLGLYRRRRARASGGVVFLDALMRRWGIATAWRGRPPEEWTDGDETSIVIWDEAAIALAFAQIKVDGACEADVRARALEAIERQAGDAAGARFGWAQRPRRVEKLQRLRAVLASDADLAGNG